MRQIFKLAGLSCLVPGIAEAFRRLLRVSGLLALLLVAFPVSSAELEATVDRTRVAMGDTLSLTIDATGSSDAEPDFSLLEPFFEIRNRSVGRNTSIVNGDITRSVKWRLILSPKQQGSLQIPAFELNGARSEAITIEVTAAAPLTSSTDDLSVELGLDKSSVYENEQLIVTRRLLYGVSVGGLEMQPFELPDAQVIELGENQYETTRNGRRFGVYEVSYAVFPRTAGELLIPEQAVTVRLGRRNLLSNRGGQQVRLQIEAETVAVKPRPAGFSQADWLAANKLDLSESWSQLPEEIRLGESLTRTITLATVGAAPEQLPTLEIADLQGANIYVEPLKNTEDKESRGIVLARQRSVAIVPVAEGPLEIPELVIRWWNSTSQQAEEARLPARTITVLPALAAATQQQPQSPVTEPVQQAPAPLAEPEIVYRVAPLASWLLWANGAWALLTLILAGLWLRERRRGLTGVTAESDAGRSEADFTDLQQALAGEDLMQIHTAVQQWANKCYQDGLLKRRGIQGVLQLGDVALNQQLQALQQTVFGNAADAELDLRLLARCLREQHNSLQQQGLKAEQQPFGAFYPG